MTSKFTLLVTLAAVGVAGVGCSSPPDNTADPLPAPSARPPYLDTPQTQMTNTGALQPTPMNTDTAPPPQQQQQPVQQPTNTGAAGSGGMMPAASIIPRGMPGSGFNLTPVAGWVAGTTNEAGIQGSFYGIKDADNVAPQLPGVTTLTLDTTGSKACVRGTASRVVNGADGALAYGQFWGGGIAFDLGDPGGMMPAVPWARGNVVGFRYTITGPTIPPADQLRFIARFQDGAGPNTGDPFCQKLTATTGTPITSMLSSPQMIKACWTTGGAQLPPAAQLISLQWQVVTNDMATTPYDFCVENLQAVTQ